MVHLVAIVWRIPRTIPAHRAWIVGKSIRHCHSTPVLRRRQNRVRRRTAATLRPGPVAPVALAGGLAADGGDKKPAQPAPKHKISWKKTVLSRDFYSEGVAVVDVNKDGKLDVIAGEVWFEAPAWKKHVLREDKKYDP